MSTPTTMARPHGPGRVPSLTPGRPGSVMLLATGAHGAQALARMDPWLEAFQDDCGVELDRGRTILYALSSTEGLANLYPFEGLGTPDAESARHLDAILTDGAWKVRGEDPEAWAAQCRQTLEKAPAGTLCTVWDVFPRP
ncbi:hypothetical protein [uncultured Micrococcus sp.]|uniref:hypothetical protein n=1 Tax=uncultured Micrococcus sp. TaxID=114051 RepID=UPI0025D13EC5|nr:hypothetical protein [uncultured Micrococcus sp.]